MLTCRLSILLLFFTLAPSLASEAGELIRFKLLPQESQILTQVPNPFGIVKGKLTVREGVAEGHITDLQGTGRVRLTIDAASYNSNIRLRDNDVQENYLEVQQYPLIAFTSTGIENGKKIPSPEKAREFTIKGILELHGEKREIRVLVKLTQQGKRIIVEGKTRILFDDFNIATPVLLFIRSESHTAVSFRFVGEQQP
ncbi:MAG: YceI family protein [Candidatus Methylomirabilales bacterium]